jgi:hypothetical protein
MLTRQQAIENYKLSLMKKADEHNNEVIGSIVKQEIINHNDAVLSTNIAINELREKSDKLNELTEERLTELESKIVDLGIDFNNILRYFNEVTAKFDAIVKEQDNLHKRDYQRVSDLEKVIEILIEKSKKQDKDFQDLKDARFGSNEAMTQLFINQQTVETNLKHKIERDIDKLKEEIFSLPSKAEEVRKEFSEELAMYKLDTEGIFKEIKVLKKTVFISEKKIEDLYNQILKRQ